jgi:DedD protein
MAWGILPAVKERLTGAVILVALMVLLVPELLTGPIRTKSLPAAPASAGSSSATATGPTSPAGQPPLRTYTLTLGSAPSAHGGAAAPVQPRSAARTPEVAPSPPQKPTRSAPAKAVGAAVAAPGRGRTSEGAAAPRQAAARAPAARPPQTAARTGSGLQVARPPAHRAVRHAPARASSGRWVVQLGVFADHINAVRLASVLRQRGFRVSVSPVRVRSRVLWRVSTAPPQARAAALHLAARLRAAGHSGDVLPVR